MPSFTSPVEWSVLRGETTIIVALVLVAEESISLDESFLGVMVAKYKYRMHWEKRHIPSLHLPYDHRLHVRLHRRPTNKPLSMKSYTHMVITYLNDGEGETR